MIYKHSDYTLYSIKDLSRTGLTGNKPIHEYAILGNTQIMISILKENN